MAISDRATRRRNADSLTRRCVRWPIQAPSSTAGKTATDDVIRGQVTNPNATYDGTRTAVISRKMAIRLPRKAAFGTPAKR